MNLYRVEVWETRPGDPIITRSCTWVFAAVAESEEAACRRVVPKYKARPGDSIVALPQPDGFFENGSSYERDRDRRERHPHGTVWRKVGDLLPRPRFATRVPVHVCAA
jgi:hypothetical protein